MNSSVRTSIVEKRSYVITVCRPEKMNALDGRVLDELEAAVTHFSEDDTLRTAIITGEGSKAFVAGADIEELLAETTKDARSYVERGQSLLHSIEDCHKPIIAAVNGFALGGGMELAMACHFIIASESARFGLPEVKLGIIPGFGGTQRSVNRLGLAMATELMLTGDMIDAEKAERMELVNHLTPKGKALEKALSIADSINAMSPISVAQILRSVRATRSSDGYAVERDAFECVCRSSDSTEGMMAFIEKRKAQFKGE